MTLKSIAAGVLDVGYFDLGPADGPAVILLHGFPYDIHAYDAAAARLVEAGKRCIVPYLRGFGPTRFRSADTLRSGEQAALGADLIALMDALSIESAVVAGYDWGGRAACVVAALWPERVRGLVSCGVGYNIQDIAGAGKPADAETEHRLWYQYYFHGARGRAGMSANRRDLCQLLWRQWSPTWTFDDATFARTAESFDNPDFVEVVIHSYRHRFGLVAGDDACSDIERRLQSQPTIAVPSIVLLGQDDGVTPPPADDRERRRFGAQYQRRIIAGVGHNLPQEAPEAFVEAVLALG
jgi:pimeloyl-ACP methyl ester carboxylesterase